MAKITRKFKKSYKLIYNAVIQKPTAFDNIKSNSVTVVIGMRKSN